MRRERRAMIAWKQRVLALLALIRPALPLGKPVAICSKGVQDPVVPFRPLRPLGSLCCRSLSARSELSD